MRMEPVTLTRYYAHVDADEIDDAMALVAADVHFAILLPGGAVRGHTRQELVDYLNGRGEVVRRHVPFRTATAGDLEFVYGAVMENERVTTGHFLASVRVVDGLITAYQVAFDPDLALLPTD
ncbi:hypothetical protein KUV85_14735 [Nocardioides panacisoli]|uniref:hypothetical protein n=1 Tax=Nocardioides panacisoli TaxID=627624 RepID=UPI001C625396|nr:hypothetical protein [Nocardioides panacisoli]QYJ03571.1 hypothetical protein KUV85_14735 [Nocardioides panacisoli]